MVDTAFDSKSFADFLLEVMNESERACAILVCAYVDSLLGAILRQAFKNKTTQLLKDLFDGQGGLATFSAKAHLAYALDLITKAEYEDIGHLRRIRNKFAHRLHGLKFTDADISSQCKALKTPEQVGTQLHAIMPVIPKDLSVARSRFEVTGIALCSTLRNKLPSTETT